jgi:hypothetical protein
MIVVCRRPGCDQAVRTPFPDIQPYCAPECARADRAAAELSATRLPQEIELTRRAQIDLLKAMSHAPARPPLDAAAGDCAGVPIAEAATVQEPAPCNLAVADELDDPDIVLTEVTSIVDSDEESGKYAGKYSSLPVISDHDDHKPYNEPVGFDEPKPRGWLARAVQRVLG